MALYDKLLGGWPVPYTTALLPTRHGDTHLIASGPPGAPPVLLLHGAAFNALAWTGEIVALSQHLRVYAIDLPGEAGRCCLAWGTFCTGCRKTWLPFWRSKPRLRGAIPDRKMQVG
jgi:hypothetical protein